MPRKPPKHKFPNGEIAREFRNHVWRHNSYLGSLRFIKNRLEYKDTISFEDKMVMESLLGDVTRLLKTITRDDSRFKEWEI